MLQVVKRKKRNITSVKITEHEVYLLSESGIIRLAPVRDDILRVSYSENCSDKTTDAADHFPASQGAVYNNTYLNYTPKKKESDKFSVNDKDLFAVKEDDDFVYLKTSGLEACVNKETGSITYKDRSGSVLLKEADFESKIVEKFTSYRTIEDADASIENVSTADGVKRRINAAKKEFYKELYHTKLSLKFDKDELIFGLGQSPEGTWNLRHTTQYLHQANLKSPIPVFISDKGYGIMSSSLSSCIFSESEYGTFFASHADEYLDFYFMAGEPKDIVKSVRYLSGIASMLPAWAYGYIQSQERYESQKEILDTVHIFKELSFPISAIVLDWMSWPDNLWGQKSFDKVRFPDTAAMTKELHDEDVHLIVSIWPNMAPGGSNYDEFKKAGLFLPNAEFYNCFAPEGRALYWKQVEEGIFRYGVDGWWGDNCEPVTPEWERPNRMDPATTYHEFVEAATKIMDEDKINTFCINHARSVYDGQRGTGSDKRVINVTRCGYPGSQSLGAVVWSGDISASWDTLRRQVTAGLQFVSTGLPYWHLDIGAFFVKRGEQWYWNGDYDNAPNDEGYAELYLRWFQYGAFLPIMRAHGTDIRREPWNIYPVGSKRYNILLNSVKMRYELFPYIYSVAGSVHLYDELLMRPLAYDFPYDKEAVKNGSQYMFGPSLMVCPVTAPASQNGGKMKVYLPKRRDWYDFYTGQKYEGGKTVTVELSEDHIPVFVPSGAIIPLEKDGKIIVKVYKGRDGRFVLYNDEKDGYGYEKGIYGLNTLVYDDTSGKLKSTLSGEVSIVRNVDIVEIIQ